MEIKVSSFLHKGVTHPDNPELKGFSFKFLQGNQSYKRNAGPYMTLEDYKMATTLKFPDGTSKEKIRQIFDLKTKMETVEKRANEVKEELDRRGLLTLDNVRLVIDPVIHYRQDVPLEKKLILSEPDQHFDAKQAVSRVFPPVAPAVEETEAIEAEVIEEPVMERPLPAAPVATQPRKTTSAGSIFSSLAPTHGQPITLAPNRAVSFDSIPELLQNDPEYARDAFFLTQYMEFIEMGPDGKYRLNIGRFNPKSNFLDYFLETVNKNKGGFSENREGQLLLSRNTLIEFLKTLPKPKDGEPIIYSTVEGRPYASFASLNNTDLFKKLDAWMIKKKEYSRSTASSRLKDIRTMFHQAADVDKIINDNFHPFRGRDRFKIPPVPRKNRAVAAKDLEKLCTYKPCKIRNRAGNSEEFFYDFWFMSATAYGINQMDLLSLKKAQVEEGFFKFKRGKIEKRGGDALEITVIITPPLKALMEKWKSNDPKSEYYFPFLDLTKEDKLKLASVKEEPGMDLETAYKRKFNKILSDKVNDFTRTMNRYLRKIAKKLKLKSHITSYSARHTFANKAIDKGIPPLRVMQAMGQKCFTSFMHYVNDLTSLSEMKEMLNVIDEMHKGVTVVKETGEKYRNEYEEEYDNGEYDDSDHNEEELAAAA